jgi:hypothetical protein
MMLKIEYTPGGETWNGLSAHIGGHRLGAIEEGVIYTGHPARRAECWRCTYRGRWRGGDDRLEVCKKLLERHALKKHADLFLPATRP